MEKASVTFSPYLVDKSSNLISDKLLQRSINFFVSLPNFRTCSLTIVFTDLSLAAGFMTCLFVLK